ncbi:OmpH family outer membrane protein [Candidatus Pelagibacter sp.]|nr:OmpH family outer membrane protein [Candidatus Pelagibacter sp.]
MFYLKRIIFFLFFFNLCFLAQADDKIAFFDLDEVLNKSISGKNIVLKIEKINEKNFKDIQIRKKKLQTLKENLDTKKNILSEEEFKIQFASLQKELKTFNESNKTISDQFEKVKQKELEQFLKLISPIIEEYIKENSISIVLNKKNVFIAKKEYDITENIIELVNKYAK